MEQTLPGISRTIGGLPHRDVGERGDHFLRARMSPMTGMDLPAYFSGSENISRIAGPAAHLLFELRGNLLFELRGNLVIAAREYIDTAHAVAQFRGREIGVIYLGCFLRGGGASKLRGEHFRPDRVESVLT